MIANKDIVRMLLQQQKYQQGKTAVLSNFNAVLFKVNNYRLAIEIIKETSLEDLTGLAFSATIRFIIKTRKSRSKIYGKK